MKRQSTLLNYFEKTQKLDLNSVNNRSLEVHSEVKAPNTESQNVLSGVDPMDIGNFIGKSLSTEDKLCILEKCWNPPPSYTFPLTRMRDQHRSFQRAWLVKHQWLAYSELQKGGFCKNCFIFAQKTCTIGNQEIKTFVTSPFQNYRRSEALIAHSSHSYHPTAIKKTGNFLKIAKNTTTSVSTKINSEVAKTIEDNRRRLTPIIKSVMFCAQNNVPLRGHRDDGQFVYDNPYHNSYTQGIFRSLLHFRIDSGDQDLKDHFENVKGNATMISKTIQNEIIECIGDVVRNKIIFKVKSSTFFTILLDETTDISKNEQLSVSVRYVDLQAMEVKEDFIDFVVVSDTTGRGIYEKLKQILTHVGLNIAHIRGQGYDGGSNMSGKYNSLQALLQADYPLATYCHCYNHSLNLAISSACNVRALTFMFETLTSCCNFFSSAKRNNVLKAKIEACEAITSRKKTLKTLCATRWVERHESVLVFKEMLPAIITALEEISDWDDKEAAAKATGRLVLVTDVKFLISLDIAIECLGVTLPVSKSLQDPSIDLSEAVLTIGSIINVFKKMRADSTNVFQKMFKQCSDNAKSLGTEIKISRIASTQLHRANAPATTAESYYRINVFIPFLDCMIQELDTRFSARFQDIIPLQSLIPAHIDKPSIETIINSAKIYANDLPCSLMELKGELMSWKEKWSNSSLPPKTAIESLKTITTGSLGIKTLLQLFATLPVSTATSERSFSKLKLIKNYLRSTMSQERLSGLAVANIHKDVKFEVSEVIDLFAMRKPRRMQLGNWGNELSEGS